MDDYTVFVRNLGRHAEGYWIAEVALAKNPPEDQTGFASYTRVHREFGSWMHGHGAEMKEVRREVAAELQSQVVPLERKELREWAATISDAQILNLAKKAGGHRLVALQAEAKRRNLKERQAA